MDWFDNVLSTVVISIRKDHIQYLYNSGKNKCMLQKIICNSNLIYLLNKKSPVSTACSSGKKDFLKGRLAGLFF